MPPCGLVAWPCDRRIIVAYDRCIWLRNVPKKRLAEVILDSDLCATDKHGEQQNENSELPFVHVVDPGVDELGDDPGRCCLSRCSDWSSKYVADFGISHCRASYLTVSVRGSVEV